MTFLLSKSTTHSINKIMKLPLISLIAIFSMAPSLYASENAEAWSLKKIISISNSQEKHFLTKGNVLEMINSQPTIYHSSDPSDTEFCHPEFFTSNRFSIADKEFKTFVDSTEGLSKLNAIMKKNLNITTSNINLIWNMGVNKDGKEPCNQLSEKNLYITKNRKTVLIFLSPYIYSFEK